VFHGGPYILLFDREIDCMDTAFVAKSYIDGSAPTDVEFVALQFQTDAEAFVAGVGSVEGDAPIAAYGLINEGGFELERGREGTLTITDVDEDYAWIEGSFEIAFTEGSVEGTFDSEYCRNMQP
jgi:hypothetical protein